RRPAGGHRERLHGLIHGLEPRRGAGRSAPGAPSRVRAGLCGAEDGDLAIWAFLHVSNTAGSSVDKVCVSRRSVSEVSAGPTGYETLGRCPRRRETGTHGQLLQGTRPVGLV